MMREFALASAARRQASQDMPELTEICKHIMFEETRQELNLENRRPGRPVDRRLQRAMSRTSRLIERLAVLIKQTPLRISITGHTTAGAVPLRSDHSPFELSANHASAPRQILECQDLPVCQIYAVPGKAEPSRYFPTIPVGVGQSSRHPALPLDLKP